MTKKIKSDKKPNPYVRKIVVTFKLNHVEMKDLLTLAHGCSKGNVSLALREAIRVLLQKKGYSK